MIHGIDFPTVTVLPTYFVFNFVVVVVAVRRLVGGILEADLLFLCLCNKAETKCRIKCHIVASICMGE